MIVSNVWRLFQRAHLARHVILAIISVAAASVFAPDLRAQNGKAPYSLIYWDFGGDFFSPRSRPPLPPLCCAPFSLQLQQQLQTQELAAAALSSAGAFRTAMGVRPFRYLQIDAVEVDALGNFNGFGNRGSSFQCVTGCTGIMTQTIGSVTGLVTTGARLVLPLFREHLLISAGGGFGWLRTNEHVQTQANETAECVSCRGVGGHGPTEIAEIMYFPDRRLGVGFHVRNVQINSSGLNANDPNIYPPGTKFRDRFFLIGGEVSIRFGKRD